jgi:hypothetical protein
MLRCCSIASLQRTVSTPSLVDFSRASHLDLFEQPAGGFFQHLLECRYAVKVMPSAGITPVTDYVRQKLCGFDLAGTFFGKCPSSA